eukprot:CAMPEP_0204330376 /NCGR_PEP_ID=MMETSP0469-20131031/14874_1 /ASSEMBLY_ACC=CAM_ASM_000384 /TAXON_ID=2969 /ORGANISM="Oxyrrhis marina" /LENGTH=77 /DNA_ID=CAMNT_0051313159 /DNA_START=26 /DNA_END=255 /DNA_ORIENTATION=-
MRELKITSRPGLVAVPGPKLDAGAPGRAAPQKWGASLLLAYSPAHERPSDPHGEPRVTAAQLRRETASSPGRTTAPR